MSVNCKAPFAKVLENVDFFIMILVIPCIKTHGIVIAPGR